MNQTRETHDANPTVPAAALIRHLIGDSRPDCSPGVLAAVIAEAAESVAEEVSALARSGRSAMTETDYVYRIRTSVDLALTSRGIPPLTAQLVAGPAGVSGPTQPANRFALAGELVEQLAARLQTSSSPAEGQFRILRHIVTVLSTLLRYELRPQRSAKLLEEANRHMPLAFSAGLTRDDDSVAPADDTYHLLRAASSLVEALHDLVMCCWNDQVLDLTKIDTDVYNIVLTGQGQVATCETAPALYHFISAADAAGSLDTFEHVYVVRPGRSDIERATMTITEHPVDDLGRVHKDAVIDLHGAPIISVRWSVALQP